MLCEGKRDFNNSVEVQQYYVCAYTDVDECATANGGCAQICTNNNGSFWCSCNTGYALSPDELGCDGKCHGVHVGRKVEWWLVTVSVHVQY